MVSSIIRPVFLAIGILSLVLGVIGIFLPLLPTTPFLLLSAYCFSRSSERLHRWLLSQPYIGPTILDWQNHGVVNPFAKLLCTVFLVVGLGYPILFVQVPSAVKVGLGALGVSVLSFVLTRPNRRS